MAVLDKTVYPTNFVKLAMLPNDFHKLHGEALNVKLHGHKNLTTLLKDFSDALVVEDKGKTGPVVWSKRGRRLFDKVKDLQKDLIQLLLNLPEGMSLSRLVSLQQSNSGERINPSDFGVDNVQDVIGLMSDVIKVRCRSIEKKKPTAELVAERWLMAAVV